MKARVSAIFEMIAVFEQEKGNAVVKKWGKRKASSRTEAEQRSNRYRGRSGSEDISGMRAETWPQIERISVCFYCYQFISDVLTGR